MFSIEEKFSFRFVNDLLALWIEHQALARLVRGSTPERSNF